MKQEIKPDLMLGPTLLIPVTRMSLRQFSAVSCVHRCPSTHQSQGNGDETQEVLCKKELFNFFVEKNNLLFKKVLFNFL